MINKYYIIETNDGCDDFVFVHYEDAIIRLNQIIKYQKEEGIKIKEIEIVESIHPKLNKEQQGQEQQGQEIQISTQI